MSELLSTRWVHTSAFDQYNKVECEIDDNKKINKLNLVTQKALNHLGSLVVKGLTAGQLVVEFGRKTTPLHIDAFTEKHLNQAVAIAGGVEKFLKALEKSIFTPAIQEKEIPFDERIIELRVKACVESLIVQGINANVEKSIAKERVSVIEEGQTEAKNISDFATDKIIKRQNDAIDA